MGKGLLVNYVASPTRESALNLAVGRVLLGLTALWKLFSYEFDGVAQWPAALFETDRHAAFYLGEPHLALLPGEVALAALALVGFTLGLRLGLSSFASALLLAHLSALHYVPSNAGSTWLPFIYGIVLFGVYRQHDRFSFDAWWARRRRGAESGSEPELVDMAALRWMLVVTALIYVFTGVSKLLRSGLAWATPESLALLLHHETVMYLVDMPWAAQLLIDQPAALWVSVIATLVFECGFLVAVLLRAPILPWVLGLGTMHALIWYTMQIFFFDQYLLYLLFVPWDRLLARLAPASDRVRRLTRPISGRPGETDAPE